MCLLNDTSAQGLVAKVAASLLSKKGVFTGYDVAVAARKEEGSIGLDLSGRNVSSYVRELFNNGDANFSGYACAKFASGPMFYMPVTKGMAAWKVMALVDSATKESPCQLDSEKFRYGQHNVALFKSGQLDGWAMTHTKNGTPFFFKLSAQMGASSYINAVKTAMEGSQVEQAPTDAQI
jgi:hypothetical protein